METQNPFQSPATASTVAYYEGERSIQWILFKFNGRVPRRIYWGANLAVGFGAGLLIALLMPMFAEDSPLRAIIFLAIYVPLIWSQLAIQIKRWHDRGKSGWWVFISVIPIIGAIWALVELGFLRGTEGPNQYGSDPT